MSSGPYSPLFHTEDWVCVSGQIGLGKDGLADSFGDQLRQALANLKHLVESEGLAVEQVAKTTVFLADIDDYTEMNEIYVNFFGDHRPARSAVAVAGLPLGAKVEIEAWVHRGL